MDYASGLGHIDNLCVYCDKWQFCCATALGDYPRAKLTAHHYWLIRNPLTMAAATAKLPAKIREA